MEHTFEKRLKNARKMANLSLQKLADKLDNAVTKQALNKYEQGKMKPDSTGLIALANALDVSVDYFHLKPQSINVQLTELDFRKYSSKISKTLEQSIVEKVRYKCELYFELENLLAVKDTYYYFKYEKIIREEKDAEEAAFKLRKEWNLGDDPIPDVVELLEDKGYKVVEVESPDGFDGMKADSGERKVIALPKLKTDDVVRRRFTALHELAHHALVFAEDLSDKFIETLCHVFACAVLYPAKKALEELHRSRFHFYERELVLLKERWGISFPAIFQRAFRLKIINKGVLTRFNIGYNKRGYRKREPGRYCSKEKPNRLERLVYMGLAKEVISLNEAAHYMGTTAWTIRKNMNLMV